MKSLITVPMLAVVLAVTSACAATDPAESAPVEEVAPPVDGFALVDAFADAGLPAGDPRDNTSNGKCGPDGGYMECVQLVTTDDITVIVYPDTATAAAFAAATSTDLHANGPVVLLYSAARTPESDRPEYEAVLAEFLGG